MIRIVVEAHAQLLAAHPDAEVVLEGHADERGSREYNVALRGRAARTESATCSGCSEWRTIRFAR